MLGVRTYKKKKQFKKFKQHTFNFHGRELVVQGYERQALTYLTEVLPFSPQDIKCECELNGVFKIRYKYSGKFRDYFPDMYVPKARLIVEVKSVHTLGLVHNKKRGWSMTCAKAIACHKKGYRFMLLLLNSRGERVMLPKNWAYMKKAECLQHVNVTELPTIGGLFGNVTFL